MTAPTGFTQRGRRVRHCTRCLMPDTRPRITFDANGVCNACLNVDSKRSIDWAGRRQEFLSLIEPFRSKSGR